ncbi:hypothetical membrane protein, conserved, containing DUF58 domain [Thermococcus kodakarensis KOD1]|uniref:Hypothetical membrane protein, conserved, containing DUF58 domain n=2 Tax=Thermococcus TaxID=2263 RepID=Q5JEK4_THEKO|nr:DUF58 domain-containing protein [Thermococcus kodakarensis]WCN27750.1 DUF58 domain-containing protein [Thermococcus kodakarensis]WCN30043.1 DUF58 domain-containing protein [Thermococcus kodakarensis]BAD86034.1 hypothetical membrane protein, conserved, containing DUF58 domain [Thermococcus kodakarensis KOD1]
MLQWSIGGLPQLPYQPGSLPPGERKIEPPKGVAPTAKFALLVISAWVIPIVAFFLLRWELVYLVLPYVTLISVEYLLFKPRGEVKIWRVVPHDRFLEEEEVEVELHVVPEFDVENLVVRDLVPEELEVVSGNPEKVFCLSAGEEGILRYRVRMKRGVHNFEGVRVSYRDPLGFFSGDVLVELFTEVVGVPRIYDIPTPYSTRGTKITIGPLPSPRLGEGLEFHAVREYRPGDPLKIINWKATARTGEIMANEFESERKVDVVFVVDASRANAPVLDYQVRAAASLMLNALNDGTSFGLLLAEETPLWVRVDYGKRHFFKCVDFLSTAKPGSNDIILYQVEHLARVAFPLRAQIVYFSPLLTSESRETLRILGEMGYKVVVISPNPNSLYTPSTEEEEVAMRLVELRRKALLRELSTYGLIIDWDVKKPLKAAIAEVIKV